MEKLKNMDILRIEDLSIVLKQDNKNLFKNFNLSVSEGEIIGIFAQTGSGKSTLLNVISGINLSDNFIVQGKIEVNQNNQNNQNNDNNEKTGISYVFQDNRLLKNLSVIENINLVLKKSEKESKNKIETLLEKLWLEEKINEKVKNLSGGEKQRVSIARAFAYPSKLLLMDEPFSSQDEGKKSQLIEITKNIIEKEKRCAIIVSHNKKELEQICTSIIEQNMFCCK